MYWETLPGWFWFIHHSFLLVTLGAGIYEVFKKRLLKESMLLIVVLLTSFVIFVLNAIGRLEGMNEFEWLYSELVNGAVWAIYVLLSYMYVFVWWVFVFFKNRKEAVI